MLQWMGGSRRKLNTSRKSTQKRQKQYFEQRKRQHQTNGIESYSDGKRSCNLQCEYSRSLDILCLENVSTVAQEHKTSCITARDNSEHEDFTRDNSHEDFTLNNQNAVPSPAILTSDGVSVDQSETNEEWTPSSYVTEAEYPEKVSVHHSVGTLNELDSVKLSVSHQISVIDLLGDSGTNTNAEENSLHEQEAHVAFSVEGLGRVETETPVNSPKVHGRSFLNCYSPPKKAGRVSATSKRLDYGFHDLGTGLDVLMQDIDFSPCESTIDQLLSTSDVMNVARDPNENFMNSRRSSSYNWDNFNAQEVSRNDELYYNRNNSRNIWSAPSFLDDGIDDLGDYKSFRTNLDRRDIGFESFDDCFHPKSLWKQDLNLDVWDLNKKRSTMKRPETYNVKASRGLYPKHNTTDNLRGMRFRDMRCAEMNNDDKDGVYNSETEDSRENLSLLSEESSSSAAVRVDATKKKS